MAKRIGKLALPVACALAVAAPALASNTRLLRTSTTHGAAPTYCPTAGPLRATPPNQCVAIPSELVVITKTSQGRCLQNEYIQVKVPAKLSYEAVWWSTVGLGTRWWKNPGTRYPHKVTGLGAKYKVPKGWSAWSAGGGSGPAGSCHLPAGTYGTDGWAVVGCRTQRLGKETTSPSGQDEERSAIVSEVQDQILSITQDVACNKKKTRVKGFHTWSKYVKGKAITTKVKLPGKLASPLTVGITITGVNKKGQKITVAQQWVTLKRTGNVTFKARFTSAGRAVIRRWLAADRRYLKHKSGKAPTVALTTSVNGYDPSAGWPPPPS